MRFVIMADGKGSRWNAYMGIPKHLAIIDDETVIERTVRLLNENYIEGDEIIITSHNSSYDFPGSVRHEPMNNNIELDRFTEELIIDDMCFIYGDTYYTENAIKMIQSIEKSDVTFFGNEKSIVAIKIKDKDTFRKHVEIVRKMYLNAEIDNCAGWAVYRSYTNQLFNGSGIELDNEECFVKIDDCTFDINTPEEYEDNKHGGVRQKNFK